MIQEHADNIIAIIYETAEHILGRRPIVTPRCKESVVCGTGRICNWVSSTNAGVWAVKIYAPGHKRRRIPIVNIKGRRLSTHSELDAYWWQRKYPNTLKRHPRNKAMYHRTFAALRNTSMVYTASAC